MFLCAWMSISSLGTYFFFAQNTFLHHGMIFFVQCPVSNRFKCSLIACLCHFLLLQFKCLWKKNECLKFFILYILRTNKFHYGLKYNIQCNSLFFVVFKIKDFAKHLTYTYIMYCYFFNGNKLNNRIRLW